MPSGTYNNETRYCKICKKKLRPLKHKEEDWENRKYHITCFRELVADIHNYNKVCYTKYDKKKMFRNKPIEQVRNEKGPVLIEFD